jgi:hypothetical protein
MRATGFNFYNSFKRSAGIQRPAFNRAAKFKGGRPHGGLLHDLAVS